MIPVIILAVFVLVIVFAFEWPLNLGFEKGCGGTFCFTFGPYVFVIADPDGSRDLGYDRMWTGFELWKEIPDVNEGCVPYRRIWYLHYREWSWRDEAIARRAR